MSVLRRRGENGNVHDSGRKKAKVSGALLVLLVHDGLGQLEHRRGFRKVEQED